MNKTERTELRGVVKQRFRVLRREVAQRRAEMVAEAEARIAERFRATDEQRADLQWQIQQAVDEANRKIEDLAELEAALGDVDQP